MLQRVLFHWDVTVVESGWKMRGVDDDVFAASVDDV
jgi:hypothetical protein